MSASTKFHRQARYGVVVGRVTGVRRNGRTVTVTLNGERFELDARNGMAECIGNDVYAAITHAYSLGKSGKLNGHALRLI